MNRQFSKRKNKKFQKVQKKNPSFKNKYFNNKKKKAFTKMDKGKKFQISYTNEHVDETDVTMDHAIENDDIMKIGRYWDKKLILEPKNTSNHIYISDDDFIYSLCENSIKILNFNDLNTVDEIKQVELYII